MAGCDAGSPVIEPSSGPLLRVVSTYPADGAGFDCPLADPTCGVPINTRFEIRFDRYLLPSTAVRQSFALYSGVPTNVVPSDQRLPALTPRYDVIERVVTFDLPPGALLQPNTHYTAELIVPEEEGAFGFRAFDGAPLDPDSTVRVSFLTSTELESLPIEPTATCSELLISRPPLEPGGRPRGPILGNCAGGSCHGAEAPPMGLDLSSERGLLLTAVSRVAHQTETTPTTGRELQNPARFGAAMPRVDPGRPDNSYLMYKLVSAPENYATEADPDATEADPDGCATQYRAPLAPDTCVPASAAETARLRDWFLRGLPMPKSSNEDVEPNWLTGDDLRGLQGWIRAGASCP